jgi:hypothetical protein
LLAFMVERPLLVVCYEPKCEALATQIGLPSEGRLTPLEVISDGGELRRSIEHVLVAPSAFVAQHRPEAARLQARRSSELFLQQLGIL